MKFMLANAMAHHYGIEPPRYNHANDIIGGFADPIPDADIPTLKSTHSVAPMACHALLRSGVVQFPPLVLLVRDLRTSLVSNYRKWEQRYGVSFSAFLRGDPSGRRFNSDLWWCFRFQNAWGRLAADESTGILVVRYEDLLADTAMVLRRVVQHLGMPLAEPSLEAGIAAATKSAMAVRADPERPPGEIHRDDDEPLTRYSAHDREFIASRCATFLRYEFGYRYAQWPD